MRTILEEFASLVNLPWVQDPENGVVEAVGGQGLCRTLAAQCYWQGGSANKTRPALLINVHSLFPTEVTLFEVTIQFAVTNLNNYNRGWFVIWEDDENLWGADLSGANTVGRRKAVADVFNDAYWTGSGCLPGQCKLCWNNGAVAQQTTLGDSLAPGEAIIYLSEDLGSSWLTVRQSTPACALGTIALAMNNNPSSAGAGNINAVDWVQFDAPYLPPEPLDATHHHPDRPYSLLLNDAGDLEVDAYGQLHRDYSVASRARMRLKTRRGEYWADSEMGSRLHKLKTLKDAEARLQSFVEEALQPLVDDGSIVGVEAREVQIDAKAGMLLGRIVITVAADEAIDLGLLELGRLA